MGPSAGEAQRELVAVGGRSPCAGWPAAQEEPKLQAEIADIADILDDAFEIAVADAMADTHLQRDAFPAERPYDLTAVMERVLEPVRFRSAR